MTEPRKSAEHHDLNRIMSHGRGGAGNIRPSTPSAPTAEELSIPHITSSVYTTGRGGQGNMAHNLDPESARRAQDVEVDRDEVDNLKRKSMQGDVHAGRGGAGNVVHLDGKKEAVDGAVEKKGKAEKKKRRSFFGRVKEKLKF